MTDQIEKEKATTWKVVQVLISMALIYLLVDWAIRGIFSLIC